MPTILVAADRHSAVAGSGWTNPSNAYATSGDNVYATSSPSKNGTNSSDFGFPSAGIPAGSVINSVKIWVEWGLSASVTGGTLGLRCRNNGTIDIAPETTKTTTTEGTDSFTPASTPSASDLNTAGRFTAFIRASKGSTNSALTANLDYVYLEITYTSFQFNQVSFRGRNDDGDETTATWKAATNANWAQAIAESFRLRFELQEFGGVGDSSGNTAFRVQYRKNGGSWTPLDTGSILRTHDSPNLPNFSISTTDQLSVGTGTFAAGQLIQFSSGNAFYTSIAANGHTEMEWTLWAESTGFVAGDTVEIRVVYTDPYTAIEQYDATPLITLVAAGTPVMGLIQQLGQTFAPTKLNQQARPTLVQQLGTTLQPAIPRILPLGLVQQLGQVSAPTKLNQQVRQSLISQLGALSQPTINQQARAQLVQQLGQLFAPKVNLWAHPSLINQSALIFDPTIIGAQFLSLGLISQLGSATSPQINQQVSTQLLQQLGLTLQPLVAPKQSLTPGLITQLGVSFDPRLNQWVHSSLIQQLGAAFGPNVAPKQFVTPGLVSQLGNTFSPKINQWIHSALVSQVGAVFSPTVIPSQFITTELIPQAGTTFAPGINLALALGLINQSGILYDPDISSVVAGAFPKITNLGATFSPQVGQSVLIGLISQLATVFDPGVNLQVRVGLLQQLGQTFSPELDQQIRAELIAQLGQIFAPTFGQASGDQSVLLGLVTQLGQLFDPSVSLEVRLSIISQLGLVFDPTVINRQLVQLGLIDQTGIVFSPLMGRYVAVDLINQSGILFVPSIHQRVQLGLIPSQIALYGPTVNMSLGLPAISQTASVFSPDLASFTVVRPGLVENLGQVLDPNLIIPIFLPVDLIAQLGLAYGPVIFTPGGWIWVNPAGKIVTTRQRGFRPTQAGRTSLRGGLRSTQPGFKLTERNEGE